MLRMAADPAHHHIPQLTLARRLMLAREDAGMTQTEFAEHIGISRRSVVNYESGTTSPKRPVLLSWALGTGVPLEWLTDGSHSCPACDGTGRDLDTGMTCFLCNVQVRAEIVGQEPLFDANDFRRIEAFANGADAVAV